MPSKTKKQHNYFILVKAYKDGGYQELFKTWKRVFNSRPYPSTKYIDKIVDIANKINQADLENLASGVEGESVLGDKKEIKVGYWALFHGKYRDSKGIPKENKFIAQIKRVDFNNKIANFNKFEFYNRFGARTETPYRVFVTNPEFQFMDYAYFKDIIKTGKSVNEVKETKDTDVKEEYSVETSGDEAFSDYTGTLAEIKSTPKYVQPWSDIFKQMVKLIIADGSSTK